MVLTLVEALRDCHPYQDFRLSQQAAGDLLREPVAPGFNAFFSACWPPIPFRLDVHSLEYPMLDAPEG